MRREIQSLIDAVRGLGLRVSAERRVSTDLDGHVFENRLADVHDALIDIDSSGAIALQVREEANSKNALKTILAWMKKKKLDSSDLQVELKKFMMPDENDIPHQQVRPRYVGIDVNSLNCNDADAIDDATHRLASILLSVRSDLTRLRGKLSSEPGRESDERRFTMLSRLQALEVGLEPVVDTARGIEKREVEVSTSDVALIRGMNDRLSEMGKFAIDNPKFERLLEVWKKLVGEIIFDTSLTTVTMSFETFKAMNRMINEFSKMERDSEIGEDQRLSPRL